ncbi:MAG: lipoprotein signal peptidase [Bacteroidaceae bacterium]|nr:lipoprotein signal peptidase [Bacteroidaceae bacterium]MBP5645795.1 lipoprotein signal peptidase [Bacteroidaceae bacterium]
MENELKESRLRSSRGLVPVAVILSVLIIDQIIKIMVKTQMAIGDEIVITSWFRILFVENNGMAFGLELIGKLFLSLFRIAAIGFFCWYLHKIVRRGFPTGYVITVSFIIAGALGNLIDCMFYGLVFSESTSLPDGVAHFTAFGDGYAPFLYGKVVDMFYFPLFKWPEWMPLVGGDIFFSPIFNFADSCITCGVIVVIFFYSRIVNMGLNYTDAPTDAEAGSREEIPVPDDDEEEI